MKKDITILIADRNPHVRKFLQREMTAAGYRVQLADTAHEVIKRAFRRESFDLVILDPVTGTKPRLPADVVSAAGRYGSI